MAALAEQRCFNHAARQAAVRCPSCTRFYCRECVTEHHERLLCAVCLRAATGVTYDTSGGRRSALLLPLQCAAAFMVLWCLFFLMGRMLVALPNEFHILDPLTAGQMDAE